MDSLRESIFNINTVLRFFGLTHFRGSTQHSNRNVDKFNRANWFEQNFRPQFISIDPCWRVVDIIADYQIVIQSATNQDVTKISINDRFNRFTGQFVVRFEYEWEHSFSNVATYHHQQPNHVDTVHG